MDGSIQPGVSLPVPGNSSGALVPVEWQIESLVALLRDRNLLSRVRFEDGLVAFVGSWPKYHEAYSWFTSLGGSMKSRYTVGERVIAKSATTEEWWAARIVQESKGRFTIEWADDDRDAMIFPDDDTEKRTFQLRAAPGREQVHELIVRYSLVMKIWLLQVLRGLDKGRLSNELTVWFGDDSTATRAYANQIVLRIYAAFAQVAFALEPSARNYAVSRWHGPCTGPMNYVHDKSGRFIIELGYLFFRKASHVLEDFTDTGARAGTLVHELSHIVKDESLTLHSSPGWSGDEPGTKCGDDGRLGTVDYAVGPHGSRQLAKTDARSARHNGDNVQMFVESSVLAERRAGHALHILANGTLLQRTT